MAKGAGMTVLVESLIGWGSLNALVLLVCARKPRRRADPSALVRTNQLTAAKDPTQRARRHGAR
jgi:hypothetical protein